MPSSQGLQTSPHSLSALGAAAIRPMCASDLDAALRLSTEAGWNQVEADWRFFFEQESDGCFVAVSRNDSSLREAVVGTVTTLRYGPHLAWISMLLVDPRFRRRGIGTRLMHAARASLVGQPVIALDATPAGQPLYGRLGFAAEYRLLRLHRPGQDGAWVGRPVRERAGADDALPRIVALDRAALGADRTPLLHWLCRRAPEVARLAVDGLCASGFCLGRHGARFSQLGPVVAQTVEGAISLCSEALQAWEGRAIVLDVPASQERFLAWLHGAGFAVQRPFVRMTDSAPLPRPPGTARTFAICGPEFG